MNNINDLKIELIPVFITIMDTLSLTQTANKLGVTQSAVSHSLKKLRDQFEDELVVREGNKLIPTSKAEKIYPSLKRWMGDLDHIINDVDFDPKTSDRVFYIATTDIVEQMFMPELVAHLAKKAPYIGIRLVRWNIGNVTNQLLNSDVSLAIGVTTLDSPNIMQRPLYDEIFACAARKNHPYFDSKQGLEDFLLYPHTMTSSGDRTKGVVDSALERINRSRRLTHTVSNFSSAPFVVEKSDCILTAPKRFLKLCAKKHTIRVFDSPLKMGEFKVKLYWTKKTSKDLAHKWLRETLYEVFEKVLKKSES